MKFKHLVILQIALFISVVSAKDSNVPCPVVSPDRGFFSANQIDKGAVVSVEVGDEDYPINLVIYKHEGGWCNKTVIAKYSIEGAKPQVDSVFFAKMRGVVNLFVIVRWELRHSGLGTYGDLYQVYAYESDQDGSLIENKNITENSEMTGVDGYVENQVSTFRLKKASDVKDYLRRMR
ncbi:hypothetical protein [Cupriavidus basilensis]|uniref:hypothetical protein n=1 Tax=Cupriavidus basilensis TaxID=68895 RepID=UPI00157B5207|nr:hypothetical protein [Cupriavidus basilensis]NUA32191.1 hypothetical protein [Cupriavidus basilensis]